MRPATARITAGSAGLLALLGIGAVSLVFTDLFDVGITTVLSMSILGQKQSTSTGNVCPQPDYTPPSANSSYFDSAEYRELALQRLSKAITFPTLSYDDFGEPQPKSGEPRDPRWDIFVDFHRYLRETYPLTFARAELQVAGGYSLIFTLKGSSDAKPIMLTGHQDVVGVGAAADWAYPPFAGHFDGDYIWGRGSSDCKSNVIGLLSVMERLIETGFGPKRTIVLAFGQDEEASGLFGAGRIAETLLDTYGPNGIELIIDEGGLGLDTVYGPLMALPALAEKGYADVAFRLTSPGGHSSLPPKHTSIGLLSHIAASLEDMDIFQPVLQDSNPHYQYLQCVAAHGKQELVPKWLPRALRKKDLKKIASQISEELGNGERYLLQTTKAITLAGGGIKSNVLPEEAHMLINSRLEISTSVAAHLEAMKNAVIPLTEKYDLGLTAYGHPVRNGTSGHLTIYVENSSEPVASTSWKSSQWEIFASAIRATFGPETIASPTLSTSNTDTRHYLELTENIFRWTPARTGTRLNAHGMNERIKLSTHMESTKFYHGQSRLPAPICYCDNPLMATRRAHPPHGSGSRVDAAHGPRRTRREIVSSKSLDM